MLRLVTGDLARVTAVGASDSEDDLWGSPVIEQMGEKAGLGWSTGRLMPGMLAHELRVILVPDLARVSLPTARAIVALAGAPIAYLERHARSQLWVPQLCWLTTCRQSAAGGVSPHLLDRFALRLPRPDTIADDRTADVRTWAQTSGDAQSHAGWPSGEAVLAHLSRVAHHDAELSLPVLGRITSLLQSAPEQGVRRELALARLSRAIARWHGSGSVTSRHVDAAAGLIGLWNVQSATETTSVASPGATARQAEPRPQSSADVVESSETSEAMPVGGEATPVLDQDVFASDEPVSSAAQPLATGPYPEDLAPVTREADSLKLPPRNNRTGADTGGPVIGVQPATSMRDISVISTIIQAAKFRRLRPIGDNTGRLRIVRSDLRSYRRAPVPDHMLVLVLDYTSLRRCEWREALLPHLVWAYVERASVCVVKVGGARAADRLRAEQVIARNLLHPQVSEAIQESAGRATPLAHGLDLAIRVLRNAFQHGRVRVNRARIVVASDGRGNIPLSASHTGMLTKPVMRQGIDDSLAMATGLSKFRRLESFVLDPGPQQYPEFPVELAAAMGAQRQTMALSGPLADLWTQP
jgi:magnesium chelatase subunit D